MSSHHLLTKADYYFPVGVCLEGLFFGVYSALFVAALWVWEKRRLRAGASPFAGWLYLVLIVSMWLVSSVHFGISTQRFLRVFMSELKVDSKPTAKRLLDATEWDTVVHMVLVTSMIWLGDVLVIYRTYIVWRRKLWVVALPILIHVTYLVISIVAIYALSHPDSVSRKTAYMWYNPVFPLIFAQNVITTGLLSYKIWSQHRRSSQSGAIDTGGALDLGRLAWLLIETAMLYTLELFVIIVLGSIQHPAKGIATMVLVPTLGIVFVLLSIRVHFSGTSANDSSRQTVASVCEFPRFMRGSMSDDEGTELAQPRVSARATRDGDNLKLSASGVRHSTSRSTLQYSNSDPDKLKNHDFPQDHSPAHSRTHKSSQELP